MKKPCSSIVFSTSNSYSHVPLRCGLRFSISTVNFPHIQRHKLCSPMVGGSELCKKAFVKIWAMTGYSNYCFQSLNTADSLAEVFSGWQSCRKNLAAMEKFASWLVLPTLGHVMRKLLDLCIGKGLTSHCAQKASLEGGLLSTDVLHLYPNELIQSTDGRTPC